jgi:hypothetical protein
VALFEIDVTNSRLWLIAFPEQFDAADYRDLVTRSIALNPNNERFAVLLDMRHVNALASAGRAKREDMSDALTRQMEWYKKTLVASVRVTPDVVTRGMLSVYDWITPTPWPRKVFTSGEVAEAWARQQLSLEGIACDETPVWQG